MTYLERHTNQSTTDVLRESIDRFYEAVTREGERSGQAAQAFVRAGFVGCATGSADLSSAYKSELETSLRDKL